MASMLTSEGKNRLLQILFGTIGVDSSLYLGLYKNSVELGADAVLTDLTEPSGYGYARKRIYRGTWVVTTNAAAYEVQTFLADGGGWGDITGYFLATSVDNAGKLIIAEHLDNSIEIEDGKGVKLSLSIKLL